LGGALRLRLRSIHGLSYVLPVRDAKGQVTSVICVNLLLERLSQRVWGARPTPGSQALVCDREFKALLIPTVEQADGGTPQKDDFSNPLELTAIPTSTTSWKSGTTNRDLPT